MGARDLPCRLAVGYNAFLEVQVLIYTIVYDIHLSQLFILSLILNTALRHWLWFKYTWGYNSLASALYPGPVLSIPCKVTFISLDGPDTFPQRTPCTRKVHMRTSSGCNGSIEQLVVVLLTIDGQVPQLEPVIVML